MPKKTEPELYIVQKRIRYHHPEHELGGQLIEPGSEAANNGLPMDHLDAAPLKLLILKGYLAKKPVNAQAKPA